MMHTWIPIHKEAAQHLLSFRNRQPELIAIMQKMHDEGLPASSVTDNDAEGQPVPLEVMDPFTFIGNFNRGQGDKKRQQLWQILKGEWNLQSPVPQDFTGIPVLQPMSSWFFAYQADRKDDDIDSLWNMFEQALSGTIKDLSEELFDRCLNVHRTGIGTLTMGLYWIKPEEYAACDRKNISQAKSKGINTIPKNATSYKIWVEALRSNGVTDFAVFSAQSHIDAITPATKPPFNEKRVDQTLDDFCKWITENENAHLAELEKVATHYQELRKEWSVSKIRQASADDIAVLMTSLYSSTQFKHWKQGFLDDIEKNGLEKMRKALADALWGDEPPEIRFSRFKGDIHGVGSGAASELVAISDAENLSLLTTPSLEALQYFQVANLPSSLGKLIPANYKLIFNQVFPEIKKRLAHRLGRESSAIEVNELFIFMKNRFVADPKKAPLAPPL